MLASAASAARTDWFAAADTIIVPTAKRREIKRIEDFWWCMGGRFGEWNGKVRFIPRLISKQSSMTDFMCVRNFAVSFPDVVERKRAFVAGLCGHGRQAQRRAQVFKESHNRPPRIIRLVRCAVLAGRTG